MRVELSVAEALLQQETAASLNIKFVPLPINVLSIDRYIIHITTLGTFFICFLLFCSDLSVLIFVTLLAHIQRPN